MKNVLTILGGVVTIVSMFLKFASAGEMSLTGMEWMKLGDRVWVAYLWMGCGAVIAICGLLGKKPLNIISLILGLAVAGVGIKYKMDLGEVGGDAGIGLWMMIGGGALAVIGSAMAMMKKSAA